MNWNLIETAPKDGTRVLLVTAGRENYYPEIAHWDSEKSQWLKHVTKSGIRLVYGIEPTHWMYLPDSPYVMYEDDLPPMTEQEYADWYSKSYLIGGVRVGPIIPSEITVNN